MLAAGSLCLRCADMCMYVCVWPHAWLPQEFRRNAFNTDSVDEAMDLLDFCYKIVERSGLSENGTYLPKAIHPKVRQTC